MVPMASAIATVVLINEERTGLLRGIMSEFARAEHTGRVVLLTTPLANWLRTSGQYRGGPARGELKLYNILNQAFARSGGVTTSCEKLRVSRATRSQL
jgi:hypothetical protein